MEPDPDTPAFGTPHGTHVHHASSHRMVGSWRLVRFTITTAESVRYPYGEDARGLLMYGADGGMSAVLSRSGRANLPTERLETARHAPEAARAEAFDGYLSYAGRWRLDGDEVVHTVELALVPNIVGLEQRRHVALDGDTLTLSYTTGERAHRYDLLWLREPGR